MFLEKQPKMSFLNSFAGLIPEQDPVKMPLLYLRFPIVFRRLTIGRFPTWWEFIFRNGLAGGRRSEKKSIQFNLRFAYSLIGWFFLLFTNFEKQYFAAFCFLLVRNSCQSQLIFLIYIYTYKSIIFTKVRFPKSGGCFWLLEFAKFASCITTRPKKNIPKEFKRYAFGHLITARSLEVMIFLWCWDILGVILLPNNGNVHRFDPLAFVLDQWKHPWQMLSH